MLKGFFIGEKWFLFFRVAVWSVLGIELSATEQLGALSELITARTNVPRPGRRHLGFTARRGIIQYRINVGAIDAAALRPFSK